MELVNLSKRHSAAELLPVINFCSRRAPYSKNVILEIKDESRSKTEFFSGGKAYWATIKDPPKIKISLSNGLEYPFYSYHVKEVGSTAIWDKAEELVLVLAHELRHIFQFQDPFKYNSYAPHQKDRRFAEIDAERAAVRRLKAWRNR